jgi:hypothetical protein
MHLETKISTLKRTKKLKKKVLKKIKKSRKIVREKNKKMTEIMAWNIPWTRYGCVFI